MTAPLSELRAFVDAALVTPHEGPVHAPGDLHRRRVVVLATIVLGAAALGGALSIEPGSAWFYPATLGVAALWGAGALVSGRIDAGRATTRRGTGTSYGIVQGVLLGLALLVVFLLGALVVARIPVLRGPVDELLDHARRGSVLLVALVTAVNGVAEELFFRGAAWEAFPHRYRYLGTTALYAASTAPSGVPLLVLAAVCLGLLTAAQRRVTGGVLGPIASHLTWSLGMLFLLPPTLALGG